MSRKGSKHGTPQLASLRLADDTIMNNAYESVLINQLPYYHRTESFKEAMSSIGGQQEIIFVPDVTDRLDTQKGKEDETRKQAHYMDITTSH